MALSQKGVCLGMATVKYGLTSAGFRRKRLPEILQSLNDRVADKLGVPIQTGSNSIFGQLHGIYAYEIADLWEQAEEIYNAMYPNTANGAALSNSAALAGISLIDAEQTTLVATCYGTDNASIPYGSQIASSSDSTLIFSCTDTDATISASKASYAEVILSAAVAAGTEYSLTIDGAKKTYTAAAGNTAATVLSGLSSQFSFADRTLEISNGALVISMASQKSTCSVAVGNMSLQLIGSPVNFRCETYGAINPSVGSVSQIVTTYAGWSAVKNNMAASVGRPAETDTALRQRWSSSVYSRSSAMVESIQAALLDVDGVTAAKVYENTSDSADSDGRPPHSTESVVVGGSSIDIASAIFSRRVGGIDTFGSASDTVTDSQGVPHTIKFNRPEEVMIWLKIVIGDNPDETLPAAAMQEILEAVLAKGKAQTIGQDVILQRYFSTIFSATTGVGYINITACSGSTAGTYSASNISINSRQIAVFDKSRIEVSKQ